jgi:hypothetical protein
MTGEIHPLATEHLPRFVTGPGGNDYLYTLSIVLLIIVAVIAGSFYFRLHSLPERLAHGASQVQYQLVAVLALIALFTHNNIFWVAALLLALVPIPDFWTPIADMAASLARLAKRTPHAPEPEALPGPPPAPETPSPQPAPAAGPERIAQPEPPAPGAATPERSAP